MPSINGDRVSDITAKWREMRFRWQSKKYSPGKNEIRAFVADTNGLSEQLISAFDSTDPDFYVALSECAGNAAAMIIKREREAESNGEASNANGTGR